MDKELDFVYRQSDVTAIADPVTLGSLPTQLSHCFIGVQFFDDAAGTSKVVPTGGTVALAVETLNNASIFEAINGSPMAANAAVTLSWDGNTKAIKATPAAVVGNGVTHYRLEFTANRS